MMLGRNRMPRGCVVIVALVGLSMVAAGCATGGSLQRGDLPRGAEIVGGGFRVEWTAPADGTVILYEKKTGKIVETESVSEGSSYDFDMDISDEDVTQTFERAFGIPVEHARFVLYFKPTPPQNETP
ncbi:MAG: hypothetical protein GX448_16575 [Planctomycetes bacterium]|nr:hypothetical protein [Planctomycetota bacterium]